MAGRIGFYLLGSAILVDLAMRYIWDFNDIVPGIGIFVILLSPFVILLFLVEVFKRLQKQRERNVARRVSLTQPGTQAALVVDSIPLQNPPDSGYNTHQPSRLLRLAFFAVLLCLVGSGLFAGFHHWLHKRTFEPINIPVSLSKGRISTGDFYVNLKETYFITLDVDYQFPEPPACESYGRDSILKTRMALFEGNRRFDLQNAWLSFDEFDSKKYAHYRLDVDVLTDAGCLNARHPRLKIETNPDYSWLIIGVYGCSTVLLTSGSGLLAFTAFNWVRLERRPAATTQAISQHLIYGFRSARADARMLSGLPHFSLFAALTLAFGVFPMMFIELSMHPTPNGFRVSITRYGLLEKHADPWMPAIVVQIKRSNPRSMDGWLSGSWPPPEVVLNSIPVSWDDFPRALRTELGRRRDWVVYLEGDENMPYQDALSVVDVAHSERAKVVLLTAKTEGSLPVNSPSLASRPSKRKRPSNR